MTFNLTINCDNAAFEGEEGAIELSRILHNIAADIEFSGCTVPDEQNTIHDINGNNVGFFELET
jgi:hypothetical protein